MIDNLEQQRPTQGADILNQSRYREYQNGETVAAAVNHV